MVEPLTPEEGAALNAQINREFVTTSPASFAMLLSEQDAEKWEPYNYLLYINQWLLKAADPDDPCDRLIITLPYRHGKLVADSTPVLTINGWSTHGELQPGDTVFAGDGTPTTVMAVSPPGTADTKMTFANGAEILCHANHEWVVYDRPRREWRTLEANHWKTRAVQSGGRAMYQVAPTPIVQFPERELPLDPYILGAWLGDGSTTKPALTHAPTDILVADIIAETYPITTQCVHPTTGVITTYFQGKGGLTDDLRSAGVWGDKHIPDIYLRASEHQRSQLLAGLIDTDGHVDPKTSRVRFVTASIALRDGVFDLATTLGLRPSIASQAPALSSSGIQGMQTIWTVSMYAREEIPTQLPRKRTKFLRSRRRLGLTGVERATSPEQGRCIQIAHESGVYLVGRDLVPTHNSTLISRYFPAWFLNRFPSKRVILTSYADEFAERWGRECRELIEQNSSLLDITVSKSSSASNRWDINGRRGGMKTAGVGGQITGWGAHLFIVDDPLKDDAEAMSLLQRDQKWRWWNTVAQSRLEPGGVVVVIGTRYHEDDFIGRCLLQKKADGSPRWKHIHLPAIAEDNDILGRKRGEPLCPARYDLPALMSIKQDILPSAWLSGYQQRPTPEGGGRFRKEKFRVWRHAESEVPAYDLPATETHPTPLLIPKADCGRFITIDTALTEKTSSDYTVAGIWDIAGWTDPTNLILHDLIRTRMEGADHLSWVRQLHERYKPTWIGIEETSISLTLIQQCLRVGLPIRRLPPERDKFGRSESAVILLEQGRLFFPERSDWVADFHHELLSFPAGTHDDMVDVTSYAAREFLRGYGVKKRPKALEDTSAEARLRERFHKKPRRGIVHPELGRIR